MELIKASIDKVKPNNYNPNSMTPTEYNNLLFGLRRYGQVIPILARQYKGYYVIVDGEHRWKGLKELGYKEIYIVLGTADDKDKYQEITAVLNAFRGKQDRDMLEQLFKDQKEKNSEFMERLGISSQRKRQTNIEEEFVKNTIDWDDKNVFEEKKDRMKLPYTVLATEGEIQSYKSLQDLFSKKDLGLIHGLWEHASKRAIDDDERMFLLAMLALRRALLVPKMDFKRQPDKPISIVFRGTPEDMKQMLLKWSELRNIEVRNLDKQFAEYEDRHDTQRVSDEEKRKAEEGDGSSES